MSQSDKVMFSISNVVLIVSLIFKSDKLNLWLMLKSDLYQHFVQ